MSAINVTKNNFKNEIVESDKPVLLDFWASWCGPCRMVSPLVDEIAEETASVKVGKVNVDERAGACQRVRRDEHPDARGHEGRQGRPQNERRAPQVGDFRAAERLTGRTPAPDRRRSAQSQRPQPLFVKHRDAAAGMFGYPLRGKILKHARDHLAGGPLALMGEVDLAICSW